MSAPTLAEKLSRETAELREEKKSPVMKAAAIGFDRTEHDHPLEWVELGRSNRELSKSAPRNSVATRRSEGSSKPSNRRHGPRSRKLQIAWRVTLCILP
jgi:hypothetical protein